MRSYAKHRYGYARTRGERQGEGKAGKRREWLGMAALRHGLATRNDAKARQSSDRPREGIVKPSIGKARQRHECDGGERQSNEPPGTATQWQGEDWPGADSRRNGKACTGLARNRNAKARRGEVRNAKQRN